MRRNADEMAKMRRAGRVVAEMHEATRAAIKPGVTTADIDRVARQVLDQRGAGSNFLNYHGFPAVICTSPNSMIVHGIPGDIVLEEGDIISIDCGAIIEGYHGDAAFTMGVGDVTDRGREADQGHRAEPVGRIEQLRSGNRLHEVVGPSRPVAEAAGSRWSGSTWATPSGRPCTRSPRCPTTGRDGRPTAQVGHGLRRRAHGQRRRGRPLQLDDGWSVVTADGRLSAHFEHTIAVTDDGPEVFTVLWTGSPDLGHGPVGPPNRRIRAGWQFASAG